MKPLLRVRTAAVRWVGVEFISDQKNVSKWCKNTITRPHPGEEATELQDTSRGAFVVVVFIVFQGGDWQNS